jgi:hypothetical protein
MKKRWIGIIAIIIGVLILLSLYIDVVRTPKIETINLESIGMDRTMKNSIPYVACAGDKLIIIQANLVPQDSRVWLFNLTTKKLKEITFKIGAEIAEAPSAYGNLLVWSDGEDVYGYNTETQEKSLIVGFDNEKEEWPCVYGDTVIWLSTREKSRGEVYGNTRIYGCDLKTGLGFEVTEDVDYSWGFFVPLVGNNFVVYTRKNGDRDIYGYDLKKRWKPPIPKGGEFPISTEVGDQGPFDLWEDRLLYVDEATNSTYIYNLTTGERKIIENDSEVEGIRIWEDYVALVRYEKNEDIIHSALYLYDITTDEKRLIYEEQGPIPEGLKTFSFISHVEMGDGVLVWMGGGYTSKAEWLVMDLHYTRI